MRHVRYRRRRDWRIVFSSSPISSEYITVISSFYNIWILFIYFCLHLFLVLFCYEPYQREMNTEQRIKLVFLVRRKQMKRCKKGIKFFFFIIQRVKEHTIPCPQQQPTRGDNTVSVAQGGTATAVATKHLLPPHRVFKRIIYIYAQHIRSTKADITEYVHLHF